MKQKPIKETQSQELESISAGQRGGGMSAVKTAVFTLVLFLAMTVQTGRMSMVLCVLAFLSLLGKRPVARLRARLCLPVVGLLAFAAATGAAAIYSPFGANALAEFYKFLTAFSLAVILLARYDREDVPGLMWGFAAVCAVIGLVSVDMNCGRVLFIPFNALVGIFGGDFSSALPKAVGDRVNGLYNDANVTACLFAMALFTALYLLRREEKHGKRFAAALQAGVCAVSLLLTGSRGALLCFGFACLVWLLAERKDRMGLFVLLVETAVAMGAAGIPASSMASQRAEMAVGMCLAGGVVLFGLDTLLGRRLSPVFSAHKKAAMATASILCVAGAALGAAVFCHTGTYTFHEDQERVTYLFPSSIAGEVVLTSDADGDPEVVVYSQTQMERYRNRSTTLYTGTLSQCTFIVPEDADEVHIQITGRAGETLRSLAVEGGASMTLSYPWLPDAIASRLLNDRLLGGNSSFLRWTYDMDALRLISQAPVFGHGLASTENLYRSVQSFQYESKYVHNHLLQALSDTGLVGSVCAVVFVIGSAWLCLQAVHREKDALAAVLLAVWVMMNLHSLMEINFSIRGTKCAAYMLLTLPVLLYAKPLAEGKQKLAKALGFGLSAVFALYLAVFGGLVERARMTDRKAEEFQPTDIYECMDTLRSFVSGNVFDHDQYEWNYIANAVQLQSSAYNGDMMKYVRELRSSGTYANESALVQYFYLPRGNWEELFAASREGVRQVRSSPDGWNLQMDFYRTEVLPAMGEDNMDAFLEGVLALGDELDAMNGEGRLEAVSFSEENTSFLTLCRSVREQNLAGQEAYALLVQGGETTEEAAQ